MENMQQGYCAQNKVPSSRKKIVLCALLKQKPWKTMYHCNASKVQILKITNGQVLSATRKS